MLVKLRAMTIDNKMSVQSLLDVRPDEGIREIDHETYSFWVEDNTDPSAKNPCRSPASSTKLLTVERQILRDNRKLVGTFVRASSRRLNERVR